VAGYPVFGVILSATIGRSVGKSKWSVVTRSPPLPSVKWTTTFPVEPSIDMSIGLGNEGALLDVVIADESKDNPLRIDRSFVIDRSVLEVEREAGSDLISMRDLNEVARGDRGTFQRAHQEKAVGCALPVAHGYWLGRQHPAIK
jgi:hypothetical protein